MNFTQVLELRSRGNGSKAPTHRRLTIPQRGFLSKKTVAVTVPLAFVWVLDFSGTSQDHTVFPNVVVTLVAPAPFV